MAANLAKPLEPVEGGEAQEGFQPLSNLECRRKVRASVGSTNFKGQAQDRFDGLKLS
jgi:hypothetical protein